MSSPLSPSGRSTGTERYLFVVGQSCLQRHDGRMVGSSQRVGPALPRLLPTHLRRLPCLPSSQDPLSLKSCRPIRGSSQHRDASTFLPQRRPARKSLRWFKYPEVTLDSMEVFSWPLPGTCSGHRTSTSLRRLGQDPRSSTAPLGHAEGVNGYIRTVLGRLRLQDWRLSVWPFEQLFAALQFGSPQTPGWDTTPLIFLT